MYLLRQQPATRPPILPATNPRNESPRSLISVELPSTTDGSPLSFMSVSMTSEGRIFDGVNTCSMARCCLCHCGQSVDTAIRLTRRLQQPGQDLKCVSMILREHKTNNQKQPVTNLRMGPDLPPTRSCEVSMRKKERRKEGWNGYDSWIARTSNQDEMMQECAMATARH